MDKQALPEHWLRGPLPGIPPLLQPVAHALLQSRDEVNTLMEGFPEERFWDRPAGVASPAFHLHHMAGVMDRLFTYAAGRPLDPEQLGYLALEGKNKSDEDGLTEALKRYNRQTERCLEELSHMDEKTLTHPRDVGRARLPSTVGGLLFHAAEHVQRHTGQLLVTVRILEGPP
jgi:uncharacterized damage-inducible protein DinB